jgi:hypothetical protein
MVKHILTFGCSFTANPPCWPYRLREITKPNIRHYNFGKDSVGNGYISRKVIYTLSQLESKKIKPEEVLVLVMWSSPFRSEYYIDDSLSKKYKCLLPYGITDNCRWNKIGVQEYNNPLSLNGITGKGGWLLNGNLFHETVGGQENGDVAKLYENWYNLDLFNMHDLWITNIEHIIKLGNLLENKNINFKFMNGFPIKKFQQELCRDENFETESQYLLDELKDDWYIYPEEFEDVNSWGEHYDKNKSHKHSFNIEQITDEYSKHIFEHPHLIDEHGGLFDTEHYNVLRHLPQNHHPTIFGHQVFVNEILKKQLRWDIWMK